MWHLVLKNLFRNKRRTLLTGSGVAISLFLLTSLAMVYTALSKPFQGIDASPRLMVRRLSGIVFNMPWRLRGQDQGRARRGGSDAHELVRRLLGGPQQSVRQLCHGCERRLSSALRQMGPLVFADFRVRPETLVFCFALSFAVALLASAWPAYRAARTNIAQALRYVG